jgi:pilus assembly protein Flp/PilA
MLHTMKRLWADECGASAAEYGVLTALVLAAVIAGVGIFTNGLDALFTMISTYMFGLSL